MDKDHKNDPHLDSNIDFFELFLGYFQEGHALKEDFPFLAGYLSTKTPESKEAIKRELTDKLKDKALGINEKKSLQFQNQLIVLSKVKDSKEGLLLLKKALAYFPGPDSQFKHDLINLSENVKNRDAQKEENNYQGWSVVDSDDFCDLLLCGTEVESCQRASGDPNFNKCLLAYIVDGKNRLIAIKDEKGVIKARSIFRLLWSQESKTPILFLDRIYPDVLNRQLKNVLTNFALQRAEHLNVSLATKQIESNQTVKVPTLYSLGGKAQYEYVDALERGQEGSKWAINGAFLL